MRKITNNGFSKKQKEIVNKVSKIDEKMFLDLIIDLISPENAKLKLGMEINDLVINFYGSLKNETNFSKKILESIIELNNSITKKYIVLDFESLKIEFDRDMSPAYHKFECVTSEMILFYYITNEIERDDKFKKVLEYYLNSISKVEFEEVIELKSSSQIFDSEINLLLNGHIKIDEEKDDFFNKIAEKYNAKLISEKELIIRPEILLFYDMKIKDIVNLNNALYRNVKISKEISERYLKDFNLKERLNEKIEECYTKINTLENDLYLKIAENESLKEKLSEKIKDDKIKEILKENFKLSDNSDRLALRVKELEEELEAIKTISDDIIIEEAKEQSSSFKINYNNERMVVLGGRWTNEKIKEYKNKYNIDFIETEDVLKNTIKIKSYDIVIFDTSRNNHINFFRMKANNIKMAYINKSNLDDLIYEVKF